jgi:hypothetical protein
VKEANKKKQNTKNQNTQKKKEKERKKTHIKNSCQTQAHSKSSPQRTTGF